MYLVKGIIYENDRDSVKYFLQIILDIIITLKQDGTSLKETCELENYLNNTYPFLENTNLEEKTNYSFNNKIHCHLDLISKSKISDLTINFNDKSSIQNEIYQNLNFPYNYNKETKSKRQMTFAKSESDEKIIKNSEFELIQSFEDKLDSHKSNKHNKMNLTIQIEDSILEDEMECSILDYHLKLYIKNNIEGIIMNNNKFKKISINELENIVNKTVFTIKNLIKENYNKIEFIDNHKEEIEKIIITYIKEYENKIFLKSKIAKMLVNDYDALTQITQHNFKQIQKSIIIAKEKYNQEKNKFIDQIKFCNEM